MANIFYLSDFKPGTHVYAPEMGQRKPNTKMESRLSYDGKHYIVDTPMELKGRGIVEREACWAKGSQKQIEGWRSYRVTNKAYERLESQYPIAMVSYLD